MSKLDNDEVIDPIVLAAMAEDPNEDEEDKELREKYFGDGSDDNTDKGASGQQDDEDDDDETGEDEDSKDNDAKGNSSLKDTKDDENDDETGEEDDDDESGKPDEAKDAGEPDTKLTRKEKREQRKQDFFNSIRKENAGQPGQSPNVNYKPLDYQSVEEMKAEELEEDRKAYGAVSYLQGVQETKYWAEQDNFWNDLSKESQILGYDPELSFLNERLPNGKPNPKFDADKTGEINEMYLQLCGFKQFYKTDQQGRPLVNPQTGQPVIVATVDRTDISYDKFARRYVDNMKLWTNEQLEEREESFKKNITKQRKNQGMRPGGTSKRGIGALKPGMISNMSDEDFEKYEEEIDKQINALL